MTIFFLFVPLKKNINNIFLPIYSEINDFRCEACNDIAENPHPRIVTGAFQKTEIKCLSRYIMVKFDRVKLNYEKVLYQESLNENSTVLGHNYKLKAWIEHVGNTILSGHYYLLRILEQGCVKMSDDKFSFHKKNFIENSNLCYIAMLKRIRD